jgi:hypothetical protein
VEQVRLVQAALARRDVRRSEDPASPQQQRISRSWRSVDILVPVDIQLAERRTGAPGSTTTTSSARRSVSGVISTES